MSGTIVEVQCCDCGNTFSATNEYFDLTNVELGAGEIQLSNTPQRTRVLLNGLELSEGLSRDYTVVDDRIILNDLNCFEVGDLLVVDYQF